MWAPRRPPCLGCNHQTGVGAGNQGLKDTRKTLTFKRGDGGLVDATHRGEPDYVPESYKSLRRWQTQGRREMGSPSLESTAGPRELGFKPIPTVLGGERAIVETFRVLPQRINARVDGQVGGWVSGQICRRWQGSSESGVPRCTIWGGMKVRRRRAAQGLSGSNRPATFSFGSLSGVQVQKRGWGNQNSASRFYL